MFTNKINKTNKSENLTFFGGGNKLKARCALADNVMSFNATVPEIHVKNFISFTNVKAHNE